MDRRRVALGVALVLALLALFLLWPRPDGPTPAPTPPTPKRIPAAPTVQSEASAPAPTPRDTPPQGLEPELNQALAEELGWVHVRCWVGEEYNGLRNVENGWFSKLVSNSVGTGSIDIDLDAQQRVRWEAPEGATEATCVLEETRLGELTVRLFEASGGPAAGVAVLGCGLVQETAEDGVLVAQVMVLDDPCILKFLRYRPADATYSAAFYKLSPLEEHEQRTITAHLADYADEEPKFDLASKEVEPDAAFMPDALPPISDTERRAEIEDAIASDLRFIRAFEAVWPRVSDENKAVADAWLAHHEGQLKDRRAQLDALDASGDDAPAP